jgi:hypothetical protein
MKLAEANGFVFSVGECISFILYGEELLWAIF